MSATAPKSSQEARKCVAHLAFGHPERGLTLAPNRAMVFSILRLTLIGAGTRS